MAQKNMRVVALATMFGFCTQFTLSPVCFAQVAAPPSPAPSPITAHYTSAPNHGSSAVSSTATTTVTMTPTTNGAAPTHAATITPNLSSIISNAITNSGTAVIDVSKLSTPGTLGYGSSNFQNTGSLYLVSTNPNISSATLSAANIYNAAGATISTNVPNGLLTGFTGALAHLNLILNATNNIWNAGSITSSGHLTAIAASSIVNALPTGLTGPAPVMQALNNLNLQSPSITNAGSLISQTGNIAFTTSGLANININNASGLIQALNGSVNVRDASFAGNYNFQLIGGDVLAKTMQVFSGNGIVDIEVNNLTPTLDVLSGDGYITANSNVNIGNVTFTGDPIVSSGGNIVFQSDAGTPGISTGGGSFSGTNALVASDVQQINVTGLILNLTGSAQLGTAAISSSSSVVINAGTGITTSDIAAGSAIILNTSTGNISTGALSAGNFVQLQAPSGAVTTAAITAHDGVILQTGAGRNLSVPTINVYGGGFVDVLANTAATTPFVIGNGGNIGSITITGNPSVGVSFVHVLNTSNAGINLLSADALNLQTPGCWLALDAGTGNINLPSGTINAGSFALSAGQVNASGTTLQVTNPGYFSFAAIGANSINVGNGLTIHNDGGGFIDLSGLGSLTITTNLQSSGNISVDSINVNYNGSANKDVTFNGGTLTATAQQGGQIYVDGGHITFNNSATTLDASGYYGGYVELSGYTVTNNGGNVNVLANGDATGGYGGYIYVSAYENDGDFAVGNSAKQFSLSATAGLGDGSLYIGPYRNLTVDPSALNVSVTSPDGHGGWILLGAGNAGVGSLTFTNSGTIDVSGKGVGSGGTLEIFSNAPGSAVNLSATTGPININASGGSGSPTGSSDCACGGFVTINGAGDITTSAINASGSASQWSSGGTVNIQSNAGSVTLNGPVTADGGSGGQIYVQAATSLNATSSISASQNAASDSFISSGGYVSLTSGGSLTLGNSIAADGFATGNGGTVQLATGTAGTGALIVNGDLHADAGSTGGNGGTISLSQNDPVNALQLNNAISADGHGSGAAGEVYIANQANADLNISLGGSISTQSGSGQVGYATTTLSPFNQSLNGITVQGTATGDLSNTSLVANGTNISISLPKDQTKINVEKLQTTSGTVTIDLSGSSTEMNVTNGGQINSFGNVTLTSTRLNVDGTSSITSGGNITITSSRVNVDGRVQSTKSGGTITIAPSPGIGLDLLGNGKIAANGTIAFLTLTDDNADFDLTGGNLTVAGDQKPRKYGVYCARRKTGYMKHIHT